uniref:Uncharacterized protein n=1 Tax=Oryza rufipogon TaxID=4529 RepID=A0A0E0PIB7_ORYRU
MHASHGFLYSRGRGCAPEENRKKTTRRKKMIRAKQLFYGSGEEEHKKLSLILAHAECRLSTPSVVPVDFRDRKSAFTLGEKLRYALFSYKDLVILSHTWPTPPSVAPEL